MEVLTENWETVPEPHSTHSFLRRKHQQQSIPALSHSYWHIQPSLEIGDPKWFFPSAKSEDGKKSSWIHHSLPFSFRCLLLFPAPSFLCLLVWSASLHIRAVMPLFTQQSSWEVLIKVEFDGLYEGPEGGRFCLPHLSCPSEIFKCLDLLKAKAELLY